MPWAAAVSLSGPLQTPALPTSRPSSPLEILLRTGLEPPSLHLTLAALPTLWKPAFHGGLCLRSPFRQAAHLLAAPVPLGRGAAVLFAAASRSSLLFLLYKEESVLSPVRLFTALWTAAHQAPLPMGFTRHEYWSGLPCLSPRNLPDPGIKPRSLATPALAGRFFTTSTT